MTMGSVHPQIFFAELGVSALICIGIGAGAIAKLRMLGIDVYMASMATTLGEALTQFSMGTLKKVTPQHACQGHGCH